MLAGWRGPCCDPVDHAGVKAMSPEPDLLEVRDLQVEFAQRGFGPWRKSTQVLHGVDISVKSGEVVGLVGESGSGKTTLGNAVARLVRSKSGRIHFQGRDLLAMKTGELRRLRRSLQVVFQNPLASFNPRFTVGSSLALPLRLHRICNSSACDAAVESAMSSVGIDASLKGRYPHELSGGQLQRLAIARALALSPALIVADEAVSKLDVSVRAQVLNLLKRKQRESNFGMLFITHDLAVARYLCQRVVVMYHGRIVESGETQRIFSDPQHGYTKVLLGRGESRRWLELVQGDELDD
jgi:ABC-type glutathione transport system ATPase component